MLTAEITAALAFTVYLMIGKQVIESSCQPWVQKRTRNFAAQMGIATIPEIPGMNLETAQKLNTSISSNHDMRKVFFLVLQRGAKITNRWTEFARTALSMLAFTEMGHIQIIFSTIVNNYRELLQAKHLQGDAQNVTTALAYIGAIPEEDRPYIKLLYPIHETSILHRSRFPLVCEAAYAIACLQSASFSNYRGSSTNPAEHITSLVSQYMEVLTLNQTKMVLAHQYRSTAKEIITGIDPAARLFQYRTKDNEEEEDSRR